MLSGLRRLASNRSGGDAGASSSSRPRAAIPSGQATAAAQDPIIALLPRIAAGEPIDDMQIGLSVRLRDVFWDNGQLARGGSEYVDNLPHDVQVRFRDALRARRQAFQQRLAAGTTGTPETSPLVARLYDAVFTEIEPVLDRFALNDKINDLALEAPNLKRYMTQTGLRPRSGDAWLESLSSDRQTRVQDAIADRNAIRNIGSRILAASTILADPAIDVSTAAARIDRSAQDLGRLFNDSGLTERGAQYVSRLGLDRAAAIEYNLYRRNSQRGSADLNLDEWQAQLAGDAAHPMHAPESPRRAAIASAQAGPSTQDPILALLPSIAAGVPIAAMQAGVGIRLRTLFNETGAISPAGREYRDTLGHADRARFRNALASRRQAYRQAVAAQATASSSQHYDNAFVQISPVLDRFALNEPMTRLIHDVRAVRDYFTMYGLTARGEEWVQSLSEDQQTRVRGVVADRNAIRNLGGSLPSISAFLADPANDLHAAASTLGFDVQDLHRLFNESGLTERGTQYVSSMDPDDGAAVLHNIQLRQSRSGAWLPPAYTQSVPTAPSSSANAGLDRDAWQPQSMGEALHGSPAHSDPHDELKSIVDDLGEVPIAALQPRVSVPLSEYFVEDEGVTELGHRFLRTLNAQVQIRLELALRIPGDVMAFYEFMAIRDRFAIGVPRRNLLEQAPRLAAYLSESGLVRGRGEDWVRRLPAERQAPIARAIADRRLIQAIGPRFIAISSTFSNAANDMNEVARTAGVSVQDLGRFLTEDGLTELGQPFLQTCGIRTRQAIEANLALRRA